MRLLLTVTRGDELPVALQAGADLVDVKDPARGALEPPSPPVLAAIARRLAGRAPLGVPLGDGPHRVGALADRVETAVRVGASYLKVGLLERPAAAGRPGAGREGAPGTGAADAVAVTRRALEATGGRAVLMAVTFADATAGSAPGPEELIATASAAGADGVMLDTVGKGGASVLELLGRRRLERWSRAARSEGLLTALAGGLDADSVGGLAGMELDVVGVRGGACAGGRAGRLDPGRCRALRRAVDRARGRSRTGAPGRGGAIRGTTTR